MKHPVYYRVESPNSYWYVVFLPSNTDPLVSYTKMCTAIALNDKPNSLFDNIRFIWNNSTILYYFWNQITEDVGYWSNDAADCYNGYYDYLLEEEGMVLEWQI